MISKEKKIVALASSTGGPKALQALIPLLPPNLDAPVCIVQHMPAGFTAALAQRLNDIGTIPTSEAVDGEIIERGHVYISCGGRHMNIDKHSAFHKIRYSDEPTREGVRPSANYMYESLIESGYDEIICVVLTGMGADGTAGITALKEKKKTTIIVQNEETCTVYGMPKAVVKAGLTNRTMSLEGLAREIIQIAGVF